MRPRAACASRMRAEPSVLPSSMATTSIGRPSAWDRMARRVASSQHSPLRTGTTKLTPCGGPDASGIDTREVLARQHGPVEELELVRDDVGRKAPPDAGSRGHDGFAPGSPVLEEPHDR